MGSLQSKPAKRRSKRGRGAKPKRLYWKQVYQKNGKRVTIRLGALSQDAAEEISTHIDNLVASSRNNVRLDDRTRAWLENADRKIVERLVRFGFCDASESTAEHAKRVTLGEFLSLYFKSMDMKESSRTVYSHTRKRLEEYFGKDCDLSQIDSQAALRFRLWLAEKSNKRDKIEVDGVARPKPLADNTVRKRTGICRELFAQALDHGLIEKNPFVGKKMKTTVRGNPARQYYIPLETFETVMATAPNARWRALISLARLGALRIPSETQRLKWEHIAWDAKRLSVVLSSKTEHHKRRQVRVVPLHPVIERALVELQCEAADGAEYVFPDIRGDSNLRTTLLKILNRAGVAPWPKLWQNLRASGATDFARALPSHVAAEICGHTEQIAMEHYRMSTAADIDAGLNTFPATLCQPKAVRKAVPHRPRNGRASAAHDKKTKENAGFSSALVDDTGLEPVTPAV